MRVRRGEEIELDLRGEDFLWERGREQCRKALVEDADGWERRVLLVCCMVCIGEDKSVGGFTFPKLQCPLVWRLHVAAASAGTDTIACRKASGYRATEPYFWKCCQSRSWFMRVCNAPQARLVE